MPGSPRCAGRPPGRRRHRSRCCRGRHREHSRRDNADTPLFRHPQRTSLGTPAHIGLRGESDTPRSLQKENDFPNKSGRKHYMSVK